MTRSRRSVLAAVGALGSGLLAGCQTGRFGNDAGSQRTPDSTPTESRATATPDSTDSPTPTESVSSSTDAVESRPQSVERVERIYEKFVLPAGERKTWSLSFDSPVTLSMDLIVRSGPPIDVILFDDEREYRAYLRNDRARYVDSGSAFYVLNLNDLTTDLSRGDYWVALDNFSWREGDEFQRAFPSIPEEDSDESGTMRVQFGLTAET